MEQREVLLHLAKKVKQLRIEKGVTQEQMYNDTGIHVARIEQGNRDVSYTTLVKIATYFEVSLSCFD
jgi:transcriptional regulator with XRE-family HTH domain